MNDGLDTGQVSHLMGYLVAMAAVHTRRAFQHSLGGPFDLRTVEFTLLMLLLKNGSASPKQLARTLDMPAPNVTALVDKLAARGLVERRRSSTDGRGLQVLLTGAGLALAQQAHAQSMHSEAELLQRLSPAEQAMLRELLLKLARTPEARSSLA
ncbi:MAG: MarR family transcriptional regulator [Rubrivivax sp.]